MIETFTNDGFNISYKTQGSGKDIIFLHGFPSTMSMWDSLVDELIDNNFRVTTIEQRGYPLSSNLKMDVSDFTLDKLSEDIEILIRTLDLFLHTVKKKNRVRTQNSSRHTLGPISLVTQVWRSTI